MTLVTSCAQRHSVPRLQKGPLGKNCQGFIMEKVRIITWIFFKRNPNIRTFLPRVIVYFNLFWEAGSCRRMEEKTSWICGQPPALWEPHCSECSAEQLGTRWTQRGNSHQWTVMMNTMPIRPKHLKLKDLRSLESSLANLELSIYEWDWHPDRSNITKLMKGQHRG